MKMQFSQTISILLGLQKAALYLYEFPQWHLFLLKYVGFVCCCLKKIIISNCQMNLMWIVLNWKSLLGTDPEITVITLKENTVITAQITVITVHIYFFFLINP